MSSINYTNPNIDLTVRVFDSFYEYDVNVPSNEYDIVYSYFKSVMTTESAAGNFTVSLFRVAQETGIPALTLLQSFEGQDGVSLNVNLAYYLNSIRNNATLLGVGVPYTPNYYAARNVVQWATGPRDLMWSKILKSMWAPGLLDTGQGGNSASCDFVIVMIAFCSGRQNLYKFRIVIH